MTGRVSCRSFWLQAAPPNITFFYQLLMKLMNAYVKVNQPLFAFWNVLSHEGKRRECNAKSRVGSRRWEYKRIVMCFVLCHFHLQTLACGGLKTIKCFYYFFWAHWRTFACNITLLYVDLELLLQYIKL